MRVIIAGSRSITSMREVVTAIFRSPFKPTEVVTGRAPRGVDPLGERWANERSIPVKPFPANWARYGQRAGRLRNSDMAEYADALIAIWDGESTGTEHMIEAMKCRGKPFYIHRVA